MSLFDNGIIMTSGFSLSAPRPVDLKYVVETIYERDLFIINNVGYEGMLVYVKEDGNTYQYTKTGWENFRYTNDDFVNNVVNGLTSTSTTLALSANQGRILDEKIKNHLIKIELINHPAAKAVFVFVI